MGEHADITYAGIKPGGSALEGVMATILGSMMNNGNRRDDGNWMSWLPLLFLIPFLERRNGFGDNGGYSGNGGFNPAFANAFNGAVIERNTSEILNGQATNAILGGLSSVKDAVQNGFTASFAQTSGVKDAVQVGIGSLSRQMCEDSCTTDALVQSTANFTQSRLSDVNTNLGNQIQASYNNLAMIATNNYNNLTLQNQSLSKTVEMGFCTTNQNILNSKCEIINAVKDDGAQTRALMNANTVQELRDEKAALINALQEERDRHRATKSEINIGSTVTSGIGNTSNAITDSIVNSFDRRFDKLENVLIRLTNTLESSNSSRSDVASVNVNTANTGTITTAVVATLASLGLLSPSATK